MNPSKVLENCCPRCGGQIVESPTRFHCDSETCTFSIWKDNRFFVSKGKAVTKDLVEDLLKEGQVYLQGLYSQKADKHYDALVIMEDPGIKSVYFRLDFQERTPND